MRRSGWSRPLVAGVLVLAMVVSVSGLLGAAGTSIKIASPKSGARVSGVITIQAAVRADEKVSYVILGVDEDRPQSSNSAPYTFQLDTRELTDGAHRIFVEAYDRYGLVGSSSVITIKVRNGSSTAPQQVKKQPATQVARAPSATAKKQVATARPEQGLRAPAAPPVRSAAKAGLSPAATVEMQAASRGSAAVSPLMTGRGPLPAPTRTAAETEIAAVRPGPASAPVYGSVASGPTGNSTPPMPKVAAKVVRGHTVVVNGRPVQFDVAPAVVNGQMQVAFRAMFESQGSKVSWNATSRTARSVKGALIVEVPIGQREAKVNGKAVEMGLQASINSGRTMIPVRFFAGAVGAAVYWDGETRTAMVRTTDRQLVEIPAG